MASGGASGVGVGGGSGGRARLPVEIVGKIFGHLEPSSVYDAQGINTLRACRLVSKGVEGYAAAALFRTVKVSPARESLARLQNVVSHPVLGRKVEHVHVDMRSVDYGRIEDMRALFFRFKEGFEHLFSPPSSPGGAERPAGQYGRLPSREEAEKAAEIWASWVWGAENQGRGPCADKTAGLRAHGDNIRLFHRLFREYRRLMAEEMGLRTSGEFALGVSRALASLNRQVNLVISAPPELDFPSSSYSSYSDSDSDSDSPVWTFANFPFRLVLGYARSALASEQAAAVLVPPPLTAPVDSDDHRDISVALVDLLARLGEAQFPLGTLHLGLGDVSLQGLHVDIQQKVHEKLALAGQGLREFTWVCNRDVVFRASDGSSTETVAQVNLLLGALLGKASQLKRLSLAITDLTEHNMGSSGGSSPHFDLAPTLTSRTWFSLEELNLSGFCLGSTDLLMAFPCPDFWAGRGPATGQRGLNLCMHGICLRNGTWAEILAALIHLPWVTVKRIGRGHRGGERSLVVGGLRAAGGGSGFMMWDTIFPDRAQQYLDDCTGTVVHPFKEIGKFFPGLYPWL